MMVSSASSRPMKNAPSAVRPIVATGDSVGTGVSVGAGGSVGAVVASTNSVAVGSGSIVSVGSGSGSVVLVGSNVGVGWGSGVLVAAWAIWLSTCPEVAESATSGASSAVQATNRISSEKSRINRFIICILEQGHYRNGRDLTKQQ